MVAMTLIDETLTREALTIVEVREIESYAWDFVDSDGNLTIAAEDVIRLCKMLLASDAFGPRSGQPAPPAIPA